jgi:NAD(P)-dependent dehydrogenase (short-subunit alcohol dehydrogenase family)
MPTAFIVGASRGIGFEFVRQYQALGWSVVGACRNPDSADALNGLSGAGRSIEVVRLDVTDKAAIESLAGHMHGRAIDLLLFNAGISGPRDYTMTDFDEQAWIEVMRTNAMAPLRVAGNFVDHVRASDQKLMAFISSRRGSMAENTWGGHYLYGSSKAALNCVVKSMAIELKPTGISCIALTPGWVRTDMGGPQAPLTPETSVRGMIAVLERAGSEESGRFFQYDGRVIPW